MTDIEKLIDHYGVTKTCFVIMEECNELAIEVSKDQRGKLRRDKLVEEMADVYICLDMLISMHNITAAELYQEREKKMARNMERMGKEIEELKDILDKEYCIGVVNE